MTHIYDLRICLFKIHLLRREANYFLFAPPRNEFFIDKCASSHIYFIFRIFE